MKTIQKTSLLVCLTILVMFGAVGIVAKWPLIAKWLTPRPAVPAQSAAAGADPFAYDPPLPSYVKDLHPAYTIQASLLTNEAKIKGKMQLSFDNPKTSDLRFFLYDYPWSPITITSIRHADKPVAYERRNAVIVFPNAFKQEKRTTLTVEFETNIPRAGTRFGVKDDIWTLTNWYPMLGALNQHGVWYEPPARGGFGDPFVYHYADYDVTFSSPEGYQWVTSWGTGEARKTGQGRQEIRYQAKKILNFSLVGSPLYHVETMRLGPDLTVDIASTNREEINRIKAIAEQVFPVYIQQFGPLPYPHVAIAETNTFTHAMEYANLAIFRRNLFDDHSVDHWLPHEIGHLWWYNSVATLEASHGWLDEGLVQLSVYYYRKQRYGQAAADSLLQQYRADRERLVKWYPHGRMEKQLTQFATNDEFEWTWYAEGPLLFDNLRRQIGDKPFSDFLKRVQLSYHGAVIGAEHLDQALGQTLQGEARYFVPNVKRPNAEDFIPLQIDYYVNMVLNGVSFYPSVPARIRGNTVYIPVRDVMEKLGYRVEWTKEKQAFRLRGGDNVITVKSGSRQVILNGKPIQLPVPVAEIKDRTMVPLDFFRQVLHYRTEYQADAHILKITVADGRES
ncbi:stalk domain-containing protein [Brevibacillus sp. SYP-B805]|uniref:stalk domain-containing protein n=1 Tax=Brevibacillus sp. SYP-B805 TaxID=1578199 RepID=UPI001F4996F2|nr:stalk domain-containing protein [Brevibacillus sp. SYP-B805]